MKAKKIVFFSILLWLSIFCACKKEVLPMHGDGYYYQPENTVGNENNGVIFPAPDSSNAGTDSVTNVFNGTFLKNVMLKKISPDGNQTETEIANYNYDDMDRVNYITGKYEISTHSFTKKVHEYHTKVIYSPAKITLVITKVYDIESKSTNKYTQEYILDKNGRATEYYEKTNLGEVNFRFLYYYNQSGQLIQIKRCGTTDKNVIHQIMDLQYQNNNVTQIKVTNIDFTGAQSIGYINYTYSTKQLVNEGSTGQAISFGIHMRYDQNGNSIFGKRLNVNIIKEIKRTSNLSQNPPTLIGEVSTSDRNQLNRFEYFNTEDSFIKTLRYNNYRFDYDYIVK